MENENINSCDINTIKSSTSPKQPEKDDINLESEGASNKESTATTESENRNNLASPLVIDSISAETKIGTSEPCSASLQSPIHPPCSSSQDVRDNGHQLDTTNEPSCAKGHQSSAESSAPASSTPASSQSLDSDNKPYSPSTSVKTVPIINSQSEIITSESDNDLSQTPVSDNKAYSPSATVQTVSITNSQSDTITIDSDMDTLSVRGLSDVASSQIAIDTTDTSAKSLFKIEFSDQDTQTLYKNKIIEAIASALPELVVATHDTDDLCVQFRKRLKRRASNDLFELDTEISPTIKVPKYTPTLKPLVDPICADASLSKQTTSSQAIKCFNCDGNHEMRACPRPPNQARVNRNRKKFLTEKGVSSRRYHEKSDRFAHLRPGGNLSDTLRSALGVAKNQVPAHVYRMRELGYPWAWWQEVWHEGATSMSLNVIDNGSDMELDTNDESGDAVDDTHEKDMKVLTGEAIYEFPGFNAPMSTMRDEHRRQNSWPVNSKQFKKYLVRALEKETHVVKTKSNLNNSCESITSSTSNGIEVIEINDSDSLSLDDLEVQKSLLLSQLSSDSVGDTDNIITIDSDEDPKPQVVSGTDSTTNTCKTPDLIPISRGITLESISSSSMIDDTVAIETPAKDSACVQVQAHAQPSPAISVAPGTPIIRHSEYKSLPDQTKFAKDMNELLFFENIPESTGKYGKMRQVLNKVRDKIRKIRPRRK